MITHAPVLRQPFGELNNSRLQQLASVKNRQNAPLSGKANTFSSGKIGATPIKRPFVPTALDAFDGENVDPAAFSSPTKKSKSHLFTKPFNFAHTPATSMPPPSTVPDRLSTPAKANMSPPRAPMTAPAGRSPKRKIAGMNKNRRISAPFTRIDPPFASSRPTSSALPFSLDAALSGTLSTARPKDYGATIQESMPKNCFFDIYEDTPEEEATNLMEHSALTLDLSSDDESSKKERDDRGKENTPPEGYDAPSASRPVVEQAVLSAPRSVKKTEIVRKKVVQVDEMDDSERAPLSDLETEPFFADGLDKSSHVVIDGPAETPATAAVKVDLKELFAAPAPVSFTPVAASTTTPQRKQNGSGLMDMPIVTAEGEVKGDIIVWEDSPSSSLESSGTSDLIVDETVVTGGKRKQAFLTGHENAIPAADEIV